jgi:hypothetical protein
MGDFVARLKRPLRDRDFGQLQLACAACHLVSQENTLKQDFKNANTKTRIIKLGERIKNLKDYRMRYFS